MHETHHHIKTSTLLNPAASGGQNLINVVICSTLGYISEINVHIVTCYPTITTCTPLHFSKCY